MDEALRVRLCLRGKILGAAFEAEGLEPCSVVEFSVVGLNLREIRSQIHVVDTDDFGTGLCGCSPAPCDGGAAGENIQGFHAELGLKLALAVVESSLGGECN